MLMNQILISDAVALLECIMRKDNNYGYEIMLAKAALCNLFCVVYCCLQQEKKLKLETYTT